ncbi:hypothetical protein JAAARDRAFT_34638 [Jaapia argillacea MUCL 33604]|uniref:Dystroglycan-type cadherin-like domain-containing protein n=1 Tax=Jaapia argillacea MUCL 33604 TaxID=933084 RepID=A0A067PVD1_9AGAM|nr:hypothetical protein JAAARDRAFT_34638 [Jaapia argillacea MUCL 33604]
MVNWSAGTAPYALSVVLVNLPTSSQAIMNWSSVGQSPIPWYVGLPGESMIILTVSDSAGEIAVSDPFPIQARCTPPTSNCPPQDLPTPSPPIISLSSTTPPRSDIPGISSSISTGPSSASPSPPAATSSSREHRMLAIVSGVVAGVFLLCMLLAIAWVLIRRRRRRRTCRFSLASLGDVGFGPTKTTPITSLSTSVHPLRQSLAPVDKSPSTPHVDPTCQQQTTTRDVAGSSAG